MRADFDAWVPRCDARAEPLKAASDALVVCGPSLGSVTAHLGQRGSVSQRGAQRIEMDIASMARRRRERSVLLLSGA
ncbi:hypothetical protein QTI17_01310 [Variovorax sp. J31P179]|uniref:hypothetical protein n=1 Tax=Variovorax sp. J31P179 TaxID=3053508 RepID=UPI0025775CA2|nr:hypothetical protein [Variovorax sp. J31P179]MDM0079219.1 hypothetical protein [Variovorax sp. J31P179]